MSSYLKDFQKRMNSIGIPYKLAQYCINNGKSYRKNIITDELFFLLIHYVLLYIEDCNIKQKVCTKNHVSDELRKIVQEIGIEVNTYELASDIINHCCENDGNRLLFDTQNTTMHPFEIHLLEGKYELREGRYVTAYELTPQCLDYIYATKEIAELGRVSIEQIKLEKAIKAGNFVEARHNVDSLILAIETQRKSFQMKERMVFTNILSLEVSEVMQDINNALKMIDAQRNDSLSIKKLLEAQSKVSEQDTVVHQQQVDSAFRDIYYVKDRLNHILGLQMNLISILQDFLAKYKEELVSAEFIAENSSIDIMEDLIRPLEGDLLGIVNPFQVLVPLLHLSKDDPFHLNSIFREQAILKDKEENNIEIETVNIEDSVYDNTEQIMKNNEQYEELFLIILREVDDSMKEQVSLADIVKRNSEFGQHLSATKVVLTSLLYEHEIVFDHRNNFRSTGDMEVFFPEIVYTKSGLNLKNKRLMIETKESEEVSIEEVILQERNLQDASIQKRNIQEVSSQNVTNKLSIKSIIKVPNMYFQLKEVEEN